MSGWIVFEGRIEPMIWGDKIYTILPLPTGVVDDLGHPARVEGEIAEHQVNLAIARGGPIDMPYLWTGRSLLDRIGLEPGDRVTVRLRPAAGDHVETPEDLAATLLRAGCLAVWEALSPGKRRGLIHLIDTAKRPATRAKRIAETVQGLTRP